MCGSCCSSSGGACLACKIVGIVAFVLIALLAVAAVLGVYTTHMTPAGLSFGSPEASLSIIAAVIGIKIAKKMGCKMCPCRKGGAAGCCSGGKCDSKCDMTKA